MKNNIIISGCSYSTNSDAVPYPIHLKNTTNLNVTNLAWPGQGNDTIVRTIKEQLRSGVTNTIFICQLSYLHRKSFFCNELNQWIDFQPSIINSNPDIKDGNIKFDFDLSNISNSAIGVYGARRRSNVNLSEQTYKKLIQWYHDYLFYLYNEETEFIQLMYTIDELSTQIKNSNNKILYLYWPDVFFNLDIIKKNNFLQIENEYSMLKWSKVNNLTNTYDTHLSTEGHLELTKHIINNLNLSQVRDFSLL